MSEIIGRRRKRERSYVTIENSMFEDTRLSYRAKGLLGYLLSKPDGWRVVEKDLISRSTEGRDAIRKAIQELRDYGYLKSFQPKVKGGKWGKKTWEYDDIPFFEPLPENPSTATADWKSVDGKSADGFSGDISNTDLSNTDLSNKDIKNIVNKEPFTKNNLIDICNSFYEKLAIGRWSKKQWNTLVEKLVAEVMANAEFKNIKNMNAYLRQCLQNAAYHYDYRNGKLDFDVPAGKIPFYDWLNE